MTFTRSDIFPAEPYVYQDPRRGTVSFPTERCAIANAWVGRSCGYDQDRLPISCICARIATGAQNSERRHNQG
ncbi:MAG: hypothetical protein V7K33_12920 [Nostoc sp.]